MPDWTKGMQRTYEYYTVDPSTWGDKERITCVTSSTIERDLDDDTLYHATLKVTESLDECYVRMYMVTIQNGVKEKFPLATVLVQTPGSEFDGKINTYSIDAYSTLTELKETMPPYGYTIGKNQKILASAANVVASHMRGSVLGYTQSKDSADSVYELLNSKIPSVDQKTLSSNFTANTDDTWLSFASDLLDKADLYIDVDELGRVTFSPKRSISSMQPVCTFDDGSASILQPKITNERDLYGIPNVVEVVYSSDSAVYSSRIVNDDPTSPTSIQARGREILYRDTSPSISGTVNQSILDAYAKNLLKSKSSIEYTVSFTHGYRPVRIGDCVRLNYSRAGLNDVKVYITSQSIPCDASCQVEETGYYTKQLWGGLS